MFLPHPRVKVSIVGSLHDREVACSASDRQGSNFESCVWSTVSFHSSHHPQEVLLAQFSLCVHKSGLKPDSFYFNLNFLVGAEFQKNYFGLFFLNFNITFPATPKFFVGEKNLTEIIQILQSHSPQYGEVQGIFLRFCWNSKWPPRINFNFLLSQKLKS